MTNVRRSLSLSAVASLALAVLVWGAPLGGVLPDALATHGDFHATYTTWDIGTDPVIEGFDPHETTDDASGLTGHVGAPTIVVGMENTQGGFCGLLFWNPDTNDFKSYGFGGGFDFVVDVNRGPVAEHTPELTPTGGGDTWSAINGGDDILYVNFRGSDIFREWDLPGNALTGVRVQPAVNGKVYVGNFSDPGELYELDPATNAVRRWEIGNKPYFLVLDGPHVYMTALTTDTVGGGGARYPDQIVRLNPTTNEVVRWNVPGGGFLNSSNTNVGFGTPNFISRDLDGKIWFTETASDEIGRLDPTTNVIDEYHKDGIDGPQSIATSGSGSGLQAIWTEQPGDAVSVMTPSESTTSTMTPRTTTTVAPDAPVIVEPVDEIVEPVESTITPVMTDSIGVDPPSIVRFPIPPNTTDPTGMTRVVFPRTVFGTMHTVDFVFRLESDAITAAPSTGLSLAPKTATNPVGTSHTVTATVVSSDIPQEGASVTFTVTAGPNEGETEIGTTDESGQVAFSYTSNGSVGTDTIEASTDIGNTVSTDTASKIWVSSRPPTCPGPLWYLAEGTTRDGFDEYILMFNTEATDAAVTVQYTIDGAAPETKGYTVPGLSRLTVIVADDIGRNKDHGTIVTADKAIVVERSIYMNANVGGLPITGDHNAVAEAAARSSWYFSEGTSLLDFRTYFTVSNPGDVDTTLDITYGLEGGGTVSKSKALPAKSRVTVDAGSTEDGVGPGVTGFSTVIEATEPVLAERPVYFDHAFPFAEGDVLVNGATATFGVSPGPSWYLGEGNVLPDFAMFLTLGNPGATAAAATITYNLEGSPPISKPVSIPANSRITVQTFNAADANGGGIGRDVSDPVSRGVGVGVLSSSDIVVERAMYFEREIDPALPRIFDGHATSGYPGFEKVWYFAEGTGLAAFRTFLTLSNPQATDADVTISYFPDDGSGVVTKSVTVPAGQRKTIQTYNATQDGGYGAGKTGFAMKLESTQPILAERPQYEENAFPSGLINGGNVSIGLPDTCGTAL